MKRGPEYYLSLAYRIQWKADFSEWTRDNKLVRLTCYLTEIPEVEGHATTPDEALNDLRENFYSYIKDQESQGKEIPIP